ncbi:hypothetical protein Rsub_08253 [Raphidocelis subcapitata]|uniref:Bowman-Birk serine protease inhibitors family domain-containing protein n=1 Tax=Raphidocelis subcapitata TaxID=307507 RepID=A0A2V0PF47_9CHLO|nr:hypothetical protein Rsub_08253 [Raphidocelis subcapitata]|eukprot:GBF95817.1 hypothetical protein Rsub_08253 [Raphidocelis subcapitata]
MAARAKAALAAALALLLLLGAASAQSFTCQDVKALQNQCPTVCACVRQQAPNDPNTPNCDSICAACVNAARSCWDTAGAPLPPDCAKYQAQASVCLGGSG